MTANWDAWNYLLGNWVGEGSGEPGEGSGGFSFAFDLQGQILVRKNFAEYPATVEKPASRHDDLMIVYQENDQPVRATYFDNEGHVIHYTAQVSTDGKTFTFLGDISPAAPRFRFVYEKTGSDTLAMDFAIAPPGKPEEFTPYIHATAHRK